MNAQPKKISVFAPAKINLYLHVTGRREDGYHLLDPLVCFADIGDRISIEPAQNFSFAIDGPFAGSFTAAERDPGKTSANIVPRAVWALGAAAGKNPAIRLTLNKALPLGAGLGGGSADAAAVLWALIEYWRLSPNADFLKPLMLKLGSDVPACFKCEPLLLRGIGDDLSPAPEGMPELFILLVHPGKTCPTEKVYKSLSGAFASPAPVPARFENVDHFLSFLKATQNSMTETAITIVPEIADVLHALERQSGALISRVSGSGSACFALFDREEDCQNAAEEIVRAHPRWWVRAGTIGRAARY